MLLLFQNLVTSLSLSPGQLYNEAGLVHYVRRPIAVADWLARQSAMREVSRWNLASYLSWNMRVGKQPGAILAVKRLAGVTPEVNLMDCILYIPLPSVNKAANSGFETQRRHHQKSETGTPLTPQKGLMSSIFFKKKGPHIYTICGRNQLTIAISLKLSPSCT